MDDKIYKGIYGCLYKVADAQVYVSVDGGNTWGWSRYGFDLEAFRDGIIKGYLEELK